MRIPYRFFIAIALQKSVDSLSFFFNSKCKHLKEIVEIDGLKVFACIWSGFLKSEYNFVINVIIFKYILRVFTGHSVNLKQRSLSVQNFWWGEAVVGRSSGMQIYKLHSKGLLVNILFWVAQTFALHSLYFITLSPP